MKPPPHTRCLTMIMVLIAVMILVTSGAGCSGEQVERYRAVNAELKTALAATEAKLADSNTLLDQLDDQVAATPDGPKKLAAIEARDRVADLAEKTSITVAELGVALEQSEAALEAALAGDMAAAVRIVGPAIAQRVPPPYSVYVLAGSTVLGGILTYLQKRKTVKANTKADRTETDLGRLRNVAISDRAAAASVIAAIEDEKGDDGVVNFDDDATQASLRSRMSTEARDLVEQVRQARATRLKTLKTSTPASAA